jgi:DNA-binding IclR family transcriptional regulator
VSVRSVERAIAILDLLAQGGWSTGAEVARGLEVHRSTALRLLATLERHALVERDQRTARYRLGRRLPQLASVVTGEFDLRYVARPVCEQLAGATGETATGSDAATRCTAPPAGKRSSPSVPRRCASA